MLQIGPVRLEIILNLHPNPTVEVARIIWGKGYRQHGGGLMDFWDSLGTYREVICILVVNRLSERLEGHRKVQG